MTKLLVSVRSAEEAQVALSGGASLIDVKEPARGPLGRADVDVIREIVSTVGCHAPVSAALGELCEYRDVALPGGLTFVKWGLAGCGRDSAWRDEWRDTAAHLPYETQPVVVAYADHALADAPPIEAVVEFACRTPGGVLLIDTFQKNAGDDHKSLFDWLTFDEMHSICKQCRDAGVRIALAGSLTLGHAPIIRELKPDWMAVRGAVCGGQQRANVIEIDRVRELVKELCDNAPRRATGVSRWREYSVPPRKTSTG